MRNFAKTPPEISVGFDELDVPEVFRRLVDDLGASEQLTADPPISSYVGVRPSAHGTISVYVHRASVSLALEPERARTAGPRTGGSLQKKNPTTWFLRLSSEMLASPEDYDFALKLAREAVAKSIAGPAYEGGKEAARIAAAAKQICPSCHHYELAANGTCMCGWGDD